jgi:hypothetical protein
MLEQDRVKVWASDGRRVSQKVLFRWSPTATPLQDLVLEDGIHYEFVARWQDGVPAAGAYLELHLSEPESPDDDPPERLHELAGVTDTAGTVVFGPLRDREYEVHGRIEHDTAPVHVLWSVPVVSVRAGVRRGELTLRRGIRVTGRVLRPDGSAASGVRVAPWNEDAGEPRPHRVATAGADGGFVILGVEAGGFLSVHAAPDAEDPLGAMGVGEPLLLHRVEGSAGGTVDVATLRLPSPALLRLQVSDAEGQPGRGGYVLVQREGVHHSTHSHALDPEGRVDVGGVAGVAYRIVASIEHPRHGRLEGAFDVTAPTAERRVLRVTGAGNLIVRFHPLGRPEVALTVHDPGLSWGADGRSGVGHGGRHAEVRHCFDPGDLGDIVVKAEGYREKRLGNITILADGPTYLDVEMEPR